MAADPYAPGGYLSIPGTGANNSATNFSITTGPDGLPGIYGSGQSFYPIIPQNDVTFSQQQIQTPNYNPFGSGGNAATTTQDVANVQGVGGLPINDYGQTGGWSASGGPSNISWGGQTTTTNDPYNLSLGYQTANGGYTTAGYSLENGYYVPTSMVGTGNPNSGSWWQNTLESLPTVATDAAAMAMIGGGIAAGLGSTSGVAGALTNATDPSLLPAASSTAVGAGNISAGAANLIGKGVPGVFNVLGGGGAQPMTGAMNNGGNSGGGNVNYNTPNMLDPNGGLNTGALLSTGGSLLNSYMGNQANQATAGNLMNMYTNAQNQAAPSVSALNSTISNPNAFFQSPYFQSINNLNNNNLYAQQNAGGTSGNNVGIMQKQDAFANQSYLNYLQGVGSQANNMLTNQRGYGADYAFGTALGNQSQAGMYGNLGNLLLGNSMLGNNNGLIGQMMNSGGGGMMTDPSSGMMIDPSSGMVINTQTGAVQNTLTGASGSMNSYLNQGSGGATFSDLMSQYGNTGSSYADDLANGISAL